MISIAPFPSISTTVLLMLFFLLDIAQQHGAVDSLPRTKRKARLSSRQLHMLSSSPDGEGMHPLFYFKCKYEVIQPTLVVFSVNTKSSIGMIIIHLPI